MLSNHPNCLGGNGPSASSDLIGDVDGPASATDNAVARFDGTTGKLIQNSAVTIDDSGNITPSGSVHGANGSAANPSFAFNSDQNTGLYRIGADNLGVAANGAKVLDIATTGLTVTGALGASSLTSPASTNLTLGTGTYGTALTVASATGNVGIGVTSPNTIFEVSGRISATDNQGANRRSLNIESNTSAQTFASINAYNYNNSTARNLVLNESGGNVGIGTTSPAGLLDVSTSNIGTDNSVFFRNTETTDANSGVRAFAQVGGPNAGDPRFVFSILATRDWCVGIDNSDSDKFKIGTDSTVGTDPKLTISPTTGDVSLSSTTAGASNAGALVVAGGLATGAASYIGGALSIAAGGNFIVGSGATTGQSNIQFGNSGGGSQIGVESNAGGSLATGSTVYATVVGSYTNTALQLFTNSTVRLTISNTGAATFAGDVTVTGALKLGNAYVVGAVVGTGSITIQDSTGTTYRIPVLV